MQGRVAAGSVDFLRRVEAVAEDGAVEAALAVDDDDVGLQSGDAEELVPVCVHLQADLPGVGRALLCAAGVAGDLGYPVGGDLDAGVLQAGPHAAPGAEQVLGGRGLRRVGCGEALAGADADAAVGCLRLGRSHRDSDGRGEQGRIRHAGATKCRFRHVVPPEAFFFI